MFEPPSRKYDDGRPWLFAFTPKYPEGSEGARLLAKSHEQVRAGAKAISRRSSQEFEASERCARELIMKKGGVPPQPTPRHGPPQHTPFLGRPDFPA